MLVNSGKEKKFFAKNMSHAMKILSDNFGSNAVILSSKKVIGGVEVIGLSDRGNLLDLKNNEFIKEVEIETKNKDLNSSNFNNKYLLNLFLKNNLLTQFQRACISKNLSKKVIDKLSYKKADINKDIDSQVKEIYWRECVETFGNMIPIETHDLFKKSGIFCFYGPKDSGKSATIAKLAIRWYLKNSKEDVAIISACKKNDLIERVSIMTGIPVFFASKRNGVGSCLKKCSNFKLVLIDIDENLSGMSSFFPNLENAHEDFSFKNFLVLPASKNYTYLGDLISKLSRVNFSGSILTRLDEPFKIGELISFLIENNLNISLLCDGKLLPKHVNLATRSFLIEKIF